MATTLVLVRNAKRLKDLILLATGTQRAGGGRFFFVLSGKIPSVQAETVAKAGFAFRHFPGPPVSGGFSGRLRSFFQGKRAALERALCGASSVAQIIFEAAKVRRLGRLRDPARRLFDEIRPSAVVSVKDKTNDFDAPLLLTARERGIKIVIPHIFISHFEGLETFMDDPKKGFTALTPRSTRYTRKVFREFSGQLYKGRLFYSPHVTRAYSRFGCLSDYPWLVGRGLSDIVCVDNAHTAGFYKANGVPGSKIRIVGDLSNDPLHAALARRNEVRERILSGNVAKPIALIAVPQVMEIGLISADKHFDLLNQLVGALADRGFQTVLSLHPKMDPAAYEQFASRGALIPTERLFHLLPAADVFLAWFSSTVAWGVLCGVPTILLDFYPERYPCYEHLKTLRTATSPGMAAETASEVTGAPPDFSGDWAALSRNEVFDGRTFERYASLLANGSQTGRAA